MIDNQRALGEEKQKDIIPQIGAGWGQSGAFMEKEIISLQVYGSWGGIEMIRN